MQYLEICPSPLNNNVSLLIPSRFPGSCLKTCHTSCVGNRAQYSIRAKLSNAVRPKRTLQYEDDISLLFPARFHLPSTSVPGISVGTTLETADSEVLKGHLKLKHGNRVLGSKTDDRFYAIKLNLVARAVQMWPLFGMKDGKKGCTLQRPCNMNPTRG